MRLTRRTMLATLLAGSAGAAFANAPASSIRPVPRTPDFFKKAIRSAEELIAEAGLGGVVCYAVADARTGQIFEARAPQTQLPPASTVKAITSVFALERLGPEHRFQTRLIATGPLRDGRIEGDLILAGGGDPVLDTEALGTMAANLRAAGVREVAGRLRVWDGALPRLDRIDPMQPDHVGYNPALSGLNLNFNRVHFGWERNGSGYEVTMDARSANYRPGVSIARMKVIDRDLPIYTYADSDGADDWTVARGALGEAGARWLPVRRPALYAGEVFSVLAQAQGIDLGAEVDRAATVEGEVLVEHESPPLRAILKDMMRYSTNLTAEVVGLSSAAAIGAMPDGLTESAGRMSAWLGAAIDGASPAFVDHSGLGDASRVSAATLVQTLVREGPEGELRRLMRDFPIEDMPRATVQAKTGTLNFVNALVGYVDVPTGDDLAFAVLCADVNRRAALSIAERERPPGGRSYARRARSLQRDLIGRWTALYGI